MQNSVPCVLVRSDCTPKKGPPHPSSLQESMCSFSFVMRLARTSVSKASSMSASVLLYIVSVTYDGF